MSEETIYQKLDELQLFLELFEYYWEEKNIEYCKFILLSIEDEFVDLIEYLENSEYSFLLDIMPELFGRSLELIYLTKTKLFSDQSV